MKQGFSFAEVVKYILKRWYFIVAAVAIGIGSMMAYTFTRKTTETVVAYEGGFSYVGNLDEISAIADPVEKAAALEIFKITADRAVMMMTSNEIKSEVFNQYVDRMYYKYASKNERAKMFYKSFLLEIKNYDVKITFAYPVDDEKNKQLARDIIDSYVAAAIRHGTSYDTAFTQSDVIIRNTVQLDDISPFVKELNSTEGIKGIIIDALIGAILGLIAGIAVTSIIYACDKRIKSVGGLPVSVKRVYGIVKESGQQGEALDLAASINADVKKLYFSTPIVDSTYIRYAKEFAEKCAAKGYKTLLMDFSGEIEGKKEIFEANKAYEYKNCNGESGKLLKDAVQVDEYIKAFDKVVLISSGADSARIDCATFADRTLIVLDHTNTKKTDIYNMCEMFEDVKAEITGVILHTISYSFND